MQVGNVFVDIKIKGYDKEDIVTFYNIKEIQIVETAGASLPYLYGSIFTFDKNLADYFQQNNTIEVSIGTSPEKSDSFTVQLIDASKDQDGSSSGWVIEFAGFIGPNSFMMDKVSNSYTGNSLMVVKQLIEEEFGTPVQTNLTEVNENQVSWLQTYQTSCYFLVNTMLHMDIHPSFPLFSFDKFGNFYVKSFEDVEKEEPKYYFTPVRPTERNQIQYLNNFNVDSFKPEYNLFSGYNKVTEVFGAVKGLPTYNIAENKPILASTMSSEELPSGNRVSMNKIQSENVHDSYYKAFAHNTNKLLALSSMIGCLKLAGTYYNDLKPLDMVFVKADKEGGSDETIDGKYLIDTIVTNVSFVTDNITTYVYVTRDNKNNVENYITSNKEKIKIEKSYLEDLSNEAADLRIVTAICRNVMSGDFLDELLSYVINLKNNLLKLFSISGISIGLSEQQEYLKNALFVANSLMNTLLKTIFPEDVYYTFNNFVLNRTSVKDSLMQALSEYVPLEIQGIMTDLVDSLYSVYTTLNYIVEDNKVYAREDSQVTLSSEVDKEVEDRINRIITSFEKNTTGLDIPFPVITLTDSQKLLPENELRRYVADQTILNLTEAGYLTGVNTDLFENILLGKLPIEGSIIQKINENAGNNLAYRFWGTYGPENEALYAWRYKDNIVYTKSDTLTQFARLFNNDYTPYSGSSFKIVEEEVNTYSLYYVGDGVDKKTERDLSLDVNSNALSQLTNFYINKGFKDRYRTLPCTKLISATKNARIYFACPSNEKDIKFYVNSKRVLLKSFPINLGYKDAYGNSIGYNVYFTETGYNSNSVMLEVRQGV